MDFIILLIIGILSLVIIKKIFGLLKTSIGIIISFLFSRVKCKIEPSRGQSK